MATDKPGHPSSTVNAKKPAWTYWLACGRGAGRLGAGHFLRGQDVLFLDGGGGHTHGCTYTQTLKLIRCILLYVY